ncbi:hypothetical protein ULMA_16040 [Patiriisocius marinus]|uniref:Grasp-with-spasm system SPASM domain peptide maturase n=1 Tax=Patiriisocius marinus TaxID=1397112 RepID=A0A5J4IX30_9FLAO|nr:hypothetical protein [Patiriisocius marinus]GER59496.1 hypothetical protein ULMA_16040 [Patiriisocius marinus]
MSKYIRNRLCIPIQGFNRAIIYDLIRNDYFFISNEIFSLINSSGIIKFENEFESTDWIDFLLSEEILFKIENDIELNNFPEVDRQFQTPFLISDVIIHDNIEVSLFSELFGKIDVRNISIIVKHYDKTRINYIIKNISKLEVDSIHLILIEENRDYSPSDFRNLVKFNQVFAILLFNSSYSNYTNNNSEFFKIIEYSNSFTEYSANVYKNKLSINFDHFFEAYNYHNYFNKKIYIDNLGNIKNGLNSYDIFGNILKISKDNFINIIQSNNFQKKWSIKKKNTLICKDCEFRYMCVDPRDVKLNENSNLWFHEYECNYNPFISKWKGEQGYSNLSDSGILVTEKSFEIDKKVLKKKLARLWSK